MQSIVLFKGGDPDAPVFGSNPHVGAFQTSGGVSKVKISKEGTAHGQWFDSDKIRSDTSAIWVGAVSGLPSSIGIFYLFLLYFLWYFFYGKPIFEYERSYGSSVPRIPRQPRTHMLLIRIHAHTRHTHVHVHVFTR